jgi:sec-independent protein translocase protein TatA
MGSFSPIHLLVLAVVAILLLGGGRFSNLMGDVAKGVKNFKKGMADESDEDGAPARRTSRLEAQPKAQAAAEPAVTREGERIGEDR